MEISYGSGITYTEIGYIPSCSALDSTHFVVSYKDGDNSNYGTSIIGTVSGLTITFSSEYVFNEGLTEGISCLALDSTHFVVGYKDDSSLSSGTCIVGSIAGTGLTVTFGSEYVFTGTSVYYASCSLLDSTHFVISYTDGGNSNYGTSTIGTVSDSEITFGSQYVFNEAATYYLSCSALDSTHFVVNYHDDGNSGYGTSIIGTVSGSAITFGSEYLFNEALTQNYISCSSLDSTHFVVSYKDGSSGTCIVGSIAGTGLTVTFGSEYMFTGGSPNYISCSSLDSTRFVVSYEDVDNSEYGTSIIGTVSDSEITFSSEYAFRDTETIQISCSNLDSTHFVNSYGGISIIGSIPTGWVGKIGGITNPAAIGGIVVANIAKIGGVAY